MHSSRFVYILFFLHLDIRVDYKGINELSVSLISVTNLQLQSPPAIFYNSFNKIFSYIFFITICFIIFLITSYYVNLLINDVNKRCFYCNFFYLKKSVLKHWLAQLNLIGIILSVFPYRDWLILSDHGNIKDTGWWLARKGIKKIHTQITEVRCVAREKFSSLLVIQCSCSFILLG